MSKAAKKLEVNLITIQDFNNLPKNYNPEDDSPYMNPRHRAYFYGVLSEMRDSSLLEIERINKNIEELRNASDSDEIDLASRYSDVSDLMTQVERLTNVIKKIDKLLQKIQDDDYGYCDETGEEIGIKRLMARPIATLSVSVQRKKEIDDVIIKNSRRQIDDEDVVD
jgi:DnaK suppressor protein